MDCEVKTNQMLERFWQWRMKNFPEFATFCGVYDYDDTLENLTIEAIEEGKTTCQLFLNEALDILSEQNLKCEVKEKLQCFISELRTYLDGCKAQGYLFPICFMDGLHIEFLRLIKLMPLKTVNDFHKIISRYNAVPRQISEIINLMRQGMLQKMTFHMKSVAALPEEIALLVQLTILKDTPEECDFYKPFLSIPDSLSVLEKEELLIKAKESILNLMLALEQLKDFIEKEYFKHVRPEIGVSSLPNGEAFYQMCLDFHLSFSMTPLAVHELGLKEVDRISQEMTKVIKLLNLEMTIKDFNDKMRKDESFYFKDPKEVLEKYNDLVFKKIHPLLRNVVKTIPKSQLEIRPLESTLPGGPAAFYLAGDPNGNNPGVFYVNVTDCAKSNPKYNMTALALHEALPGHHLQLSHLMEEESLPSFRKFVEDRKYSVAPSHFPSHTAYIEGWGLYSEHLGYELGLYEDPYDNFGHLSMEMLRATRLVVDTGIHAFGWSYDRAVKYMLENTANAKKEIENEVNRYISLPGQACAYKVGELKLKSLREKAATELGTRFDLKEFHDMVLRNCGSLGLLEQKTQEFIQVNS